MAGASRRGSAVLVHGGWSNPDDWQWVKRRLEDLDVHVEVPDLPSHHRAAAGLVQDAAEVQNAIRSCPAPVVAVGWSYGGTVIGVAAAGEATVTRLIYVAAIPAAVRNQDGDPSWAEEDPHVIVRQDGMLVLDNDWWLAEEKGATFLPEVTEHLRGHPRRPASLRTVTDPVPAAAWQTIPTTVLLGRHDELMSADEVAWVTEQVKDVRMLDTDHFILFRKPDAISDVVAEALGGGALPDWQ
jgi:pimeloyl-ACP methyl ester carboxylesterase